MKCKGVCVCMCECVFVGCGAPDREDTGGICVFWLVMWCELCCPLSLSFYGGGRGHVLKY